MPVGLYCQGPGGTALAVALEAARAGADPIATAAYPVADRRVPASARAVLRRRSRASASTPASTSSGPGRSRARSTSTSAPATRAPRVSPHVSLLAALNRVNAGPDREPRAPARRTSTRPTGCTRCWRSSTSSAPRSARRRPRRRSARCIVRQAVDHVLSGQRWSVDDGGDAPARAGRVGPDARRRSPTRRSPPRRAQEPAPRRDRGARPRRRPRPGRRASPAPRRSSAWSRCSATTRGALIERVRGRDFPNAAHRAHGRRRARPSASAAWSRSSRTPAPAS